jgi:hypothetical protein
VNVLRNLTAIFLSLLMQGPAVLVQEAAWVNMLVSYTLERGFQRGVIETFDGGHPCELCKAAESMRQQDDGDAPQPSAPHENRQPLVWNPMMLPPKGFTTPTPRGMELKLLPAVWRSTARILLAEGPDTPPPKRA